MLINIWMGVLANTRSFFTNLVRQPEVLISFQGKNGFPYIGFVFF